MTGQHEISNLKNTSLSWQKLIGLLLIGIIVTACLLFISHGAALPAAIAKLALGEKLLLTGIFGVGLPSIAQYSKIAYLDPFNGKPSGKDKLKRVAKLTAWGAGALPMLVVCALPISKALGVAAHKAAGYHFLSHLVGGSVFAKVAVAFLFLAAIQLVGSAVVTYFQSRAAELKSANNGEYTKSAKVMNVAAKGLAFILPLSLAAFTTQGAVFIASKMGMISATATTTQAVGAAAGVSAIPAVTLASVATVATFTGSSPDSSEGQKPKLEIA